MMNTLSHLPALSSKVTVNTRTRERRSPRWRRSVALCFGLLVACSNAGGRDDDANTVGGANGSDPLTPSVTPVGGSQAGATTPPGSGGTHSPGSTPPATGQTGANPSVPPPAGGSGSDTPPTDGTSSDDGPSGDTSTNGESTDPAPSAPQEEYPDPTSPPPDEDGYQLWLRYPQVVLPQLLGEYRAAFTHVVQSNSSPTQEAAAHELLLGLSGLTGAEVTAQAEPSDGAVVLGTPESSTLIAGSALAERLPDVGSEGYLVERVDLDGKHVTLVAGNTDIGVLYGSFALLRHLQMHRSSAELALSGTPKVEHRLLNHWDNLDRSVERGYAGRSLWDWNALPGSVAERYRDYARANASLGINGTALTNVNANAQVLTPQYLNKVKALADVFRPYGIQVFLTARFSAPIEIGGLNTADPTNAQVQNWWASKASEIYELIPDFGGFLVKANSEGQPGPQDYNRNHAEGANMLADAVKPHGGIVMWRAFVYAEGSPVDRIREAYDEFKPLDGQFRDNVLVQVKNGPLDFQPREPFAPLFGGMPQTPLVLELQITKEYLGMDTHLAYLGPMYEEVLQADTFANGEGSTVARVIDGSVHNYPTSAIAGVANIGTDTTWSGSHFNQANWYVYGRMAWNPDISASAVADEWIRQTLSNHPDVVGPVLEMMMKSHEAVVNYMTPLGLVHIMGTDHHYGPAPWVDNLGRDEWNPAYYHRADAQGIGFDRTASGSNAVEQYFTPVREVFASREQVPEELLLFFHRVGWQETLSSGRTLWQELVHRYSLGVDMVSEMRTAWGTVQAHIDAQRFSEIAEYLQIQHYEARWWRDACLQYFRQFANLEIPSGYAEPAQPLNFYQGLSCPADPTRPRCDPIYTGDPSPAILP